jgi:peptide subunit release factor 1 (eRF1)
VAAANKHKNEELTTMKDKRRRLEIDCISMEADADKLAEQAETTSKLTFIAKSSAFRRAAKSKRYEMKKLDDDIASFMDKSC